jgi:folate-binding protein YgfZ
MAARIAAAGARPGSAGDYDAERVERLLPMRGAEIDGQANPLELGLVELVDFAKGCYIGQEVIARLHNYEKVQRGLRLVRLDRPLEAGSPWPPIAAGERPAGRARRGRVCTVVPAPDGHGWLATVLEPRAADSP